LKRAAEQGATNILIRASELCRSVRMGTSSMDACCDAMQNEIKPGDVVVLHRNSGAGMTVRYLLPRLAANEVSISATCARKITGQSCAGDHALRLGTPRRGEVRVPTDGADGPLRRPYLSCPKALPVDLSMKWSRAQAGQMTAT
jgi:hypothetical protein